MQKETIYFLKAENGVEVKRRAGGIDSYPVLDCQIFAGGVETPKASRGLEL